MISIFKYSIVFLFAICISFTLVAQKQVSLFVRNNSISPFELYQSEKNLDSLEIQQYISDNLIDFYSQAYVTAAYDSIVEKADVVQVYFTKGAKYYWSNISYAGFDSYKKIEFQNLSKNRVFDINKLNVFFVEILNSEAELGFPFAEIYLDSIQITQDTMVSARININRGDRYYFDSIIIKGESKIKKHYLEKYLEIKKEDVFSLDKLNSIDKKIKGLLFVEQSRPYQLAFTEDKTDLILYLRDKKANSFNGMIGILPNNKTTGKLLVTGDVNLFLVNSIGAGELFSFRWQKFEALSQKLNTEFSIPYLFKTQFGVGAQFDIEKIDSSYLNTNFIGKIILGSNTGNGFEVFYQKTGSYLLRELIGNEQASLSDYSTNLFGVTYRYTNTNNNYNPRKGLELNLSSGFGTKTINDEDEIKPSFQNRSHIVVSSYIPIGKYMTLKMRNYTSMIYSKTIFDNELGLLGGLNTLRGFDELSIPVSSFSLLNTELRYIFEEQSAFFVLYDLAYFERRYTQHDSYNYAMGIGVGLDLKTNAGVFSLVYAVGKQNDGQFVLNNSKIHFGYRSVF